MFARWKQESELRKGLELSLTMSLFGIPEILVINSKYDEKVTSILQSFIPHRIRLVILLLDPDSVCTDCASVYIRELRTSAYPRNEGLVNIKYFGVPQMYVNEVIEKTTSY